MQLDMGPRQNASNVLTGVKMAIKSATPPGDEHHGDAAGPWLAGAHRGDKPVCVHATSDPLLGAVHLSSWQRVEMG